MRNINSRMTAIIAIEIGSAKASSSIWIIFSPSVFVESRNVLSQHHASNELVFVLCKYLAMHTVIENCWDDNIQDNYFQ